MSPVSTPLSLEMSWPQDLEVIPALHQDLVSLEPPSAFWRGHVEALTVHPEGGGQINDGKAIQPA